MKVFKRDIPIYYGYFRVIICKDFTKAVKKFNIDTDGINVENFGSFVYTEIETGKNPTHTIVLKRDIKPDLIAHEAVHLTNSVFIATCMQLDRHNDEPQAYLTGWFVNEIYKALGK